MNQYFGDAILKWICILVFAFLIFIIVSTILAYQQGAFASTSSASHEYKFVYCHNEVTNTTITYPEGTKCGEPNNIDDDDDDDGIDSDEATEQEEKAMREADKND